MMGGDVFSLFTTVGGGGLTPSPSHNTSTASGPMCLMRGCPSHRWVGHASPGLGYPPARSGCGNPPGQVRMGNPPPKERLCLDRLCPGWYASCGFSQVDFLVSIAYWQLCTGARHVFTSVV